MIYKKLRNSLRGTVEVSVECAMPERVLNLCAVRGIPFWNLRWVDEIHLTFSTAKGSAAAWQDIARRTSAQLTFGAERGVPRMMQRLRRRYVLLIALAAFLVLVWYGNTFVWTLEVTGNETMSETVILRALEKQGVRAGIRATAIDQDVLRNHVLLELPELSWLAVNVTGCTAHVQVVERRRPGETVKDGEAQNVVATRDGLVVKAEILRGQGRVAKGDTVMAGEVLVSGIPEDIHSTHAMGRIYARTWYTLTIAQPLETEEKRPTDKGRVRWAVDIGKKRIKFPARGSAWETNCDRITVYHKLSLPFGVRLPVTLVQTTETEYEKVPVQRSIAEAQTIAEQELLAQLRREMTATGEVVSTAFSVRQAGTILFVTLTAECYENIAGEVKMTNVG